MKIKNVLIIVLTVLVFLSGAVLGVSAVYRIDEVRVEAYTISEDAKTEKLHGAKVTAGDLRGGAALVVAALKADGQSEVVDLSHVDRGYADFEYKLKRLGAKIRRVHV